MDENKKEEMVTLKISVKDAVEMFNATYWLIKKGLNGDDTNLLDSEFQAMLDFMKVLFDELNERGFIRRKEGTKGDFEACLN